eukprot:COSAG01_NODE_6514_length_3626_cov_3.005954_1_plen_616_part_00
MSAAAAGTCVISNDVRVCRHVYVMKVCLRRDLEDMLLNRTTRSSSTIKTALLLYGLCARDVPGDGNCQFYALAKSLFNDISRHAEVRAAVVEELLANPARYQRFPEDYGFEGAEYPDYDTFVADMKNDKTWGNFTTLQAAARVYGRDINLVGPSGHLTEVHHEQLTMDESTEDDEPSTPTIWLAYKDQNHYMATALLDTNTTPIISEETVRTTLENLIARFHKSTIEPHTPARNRKSAPKRKRKKKSAPARKKKSDTDDDDDDGEYIADENTYPTIDADRDDDAEDPCFKKAMSKDTGRSKLPKDAQQALPAFLTKLNQMDPSEYDCSEKGVYNVNMPAKALEHTSCVDQTILNDAAANFLADISPDVMLYSIVGSSDSNRKITPYGTAAPGEKLDPLKVKYNVTEIAETARHAASDNEYVAPPKKETLIDDHVQPGHEDDDFDGLGAVVGAVANQTGNALKRNQTVQWMQRGCVMAHPATPQGILSSKQGLGGHIDDKCSYNIQGIIRAADGASFCLFWIDGEWCALCYLPGVSGYIIGRYLTIKYFHLVPAHAMVVYSFILDGWLSVGRGKTQRVMTADEVIEVVASAGVQVTTTAPLVRWCWMAWADRPDFW